ncbi:MAG: SemiSWEET family transporter [Aliidongia sp.]
MWTDAIGWAGAAILLATIGRQVYVQWRDETSVGLSKWLFIGQSVSSVIFTIYSLMLANWVFAVTNGALLLTAIIGQILFVRYRRKSSRR